MGGNKVIDNYVLLKVIGSGQFGDVHRAKRLDTEEYYAIKAIKLDKFQNTPQLNILTRNEVEILSKIDNANIIKFVKMLKTANNIYIVYELCNGGTLEELLDKKKFLSEQEATDIFKQVLNACKTLVELNILHRDIKPSNILFNDEIVKVADFGFCKSLKSHTDLTETMVGSPVYMGPEILKGQPYSMKADIYSLGVLFYEMLYGIVPFEDVSIPGLLSKIKEGNIVFHTFNKISTFTENLIKKMLDPSPTCRIDWTELFDAFNENAILENNSKLKMEKPLEIKQVEVKPQNTNLANLDFKPVLDQLYNATPIETRETRDEKASMAKYISECKVIRDKLVFLWRAYNLGCENIVNEESHHVNFMILKKMHRINHEILELFQNKKQVFNSEEFKIIKDQIDYGRTFSLMNNEIMKFDEIFSMYRNFLITTVEKKKSPKEIDLELTSYEHNEDFFKEKVMTYCTKLRTKIESEINYDEYLCQRYGLMLNLLLDGVMINEVFENFFEVNVTFNNQPYLNQLYNLEKKELLDFADYKLKYLKGK